MGFPNVDLILVSLFMTKFTQAQLDPESVLPDLFEDLPITQRVEIARYLQRKNFCNDARKHEKDSIYIIPSLPLLEVAFPQICISLGAGVSDRFMGDMDDEQTEARDDSGQLIGWDVSKGYFEKANWDIHVVCATKDEAIWLSRLCQLFICQAFGELGRRGVMEVTISIQDLPLADNALQPNTIFNRAIRLSATVANTWKERIPLAEYETGTNTSL